MMINVLENLRLDHACLLRMINQSSFGGAKTDVRVREPEQLAESLSSAIAEIERWQKTTEHFRQEVGKLHSQLGRKDDVIAKLNQALDALWKEAESAYCQALDRFSKTECLGWEAKARTGVFGRAEYEAHKAANELIGRHQGIAHAVKTLRGALEENAHA